MITRLTQLILLVGTTSVLFTACDSPGGSRHERHMAEAANSGKVGTISGGESFQAAAPYDKTYEAILTYLKKKDCMIETSNKETGQIVTAHEIAGGWRQVGTRNVITLIKENDTATTVKVMVTEQRRFKAFQIEPWEDPTVNATKTLALAGELKENLILVAGSVAGK